MRHASTEYYALVQAGLSESYASQISSGKRSPSLRLALEIYRKTGLKYGQLERASAKEIGLITKLSGVLL